MSADRWNRGKHADVDSASSSLESIQTALDEQIAYYRARANEYDDWFLRRGRYARGAEHLELWFMEVEQVLSEIERFAPYGDVLELAAGTGQWTMRLVPNSDSLTVVDASSEMIEINRARMEGQRVTYIEHDLFSFTTDRKFDFIFFGFWLSHVPKNRFDEFWELIRSWLKPDGHFFFVDSLRESTSTAVDHLLPIEEDSETLVRKLNDGREYRIFKRFYKPDVLQCQLGQLDFKAKVDATNTFFLFGSGQSLI